MVPIPNLNAASFRFEQGPYDSGEVGPHGNPRWRSDASSCGFEFVDDGTAAETLRLWMNTGVRVSLVAIGLAKCIQWYERDHFTVYPIPLQGAATGRADLFRFDINRQGHGRHNIHNRQNLLSHVGTFGTGGWSDTTANNLVDGYNSTSGPTYAFASGVQSTTHDAADHGPYVDIVLPVRLASLSLVYFSEVTALHAQVSNATVRVDQRNFAGTQVATKETSPGATGRTTVTFTPDADLYTLRLWPGQTPGGISVSGTVSCKDPGLRVDGGTAYVPS